MRILWSIAPALLAISVPAAAQMDFRGYALGMTIEEFRARQTPPGWRDRPTRVACSDTDPKLSWLAPPDGYAEAGVIQCSFVSDSGYGPSREDFPLTPSKASATVAFSFYQRRLYFIETYMDAIHSATIDEALLAKLGPNPKVEEGKFQTRAGAVFPQIVKTWRQGDQIAVMTTPDLTTQRMSVHYMDEKAAAEVQAKVRASRDPASIM